MVVPQPEILYSDPGSTIAIERNCLMVVYFEPPGLEAFPILEHHAGKAAARFPEGLGLVNVAAPKAGQSRGLGSQARERLGLMIRENRVHARAVAQVVSVGGLEGAAVRMVMSTMALLSRTAVPVRVFGQTAAAARWIVPHLGAAGSSPGAEREITEALFALCHAG